MARISTGNRLRATAALLLMAIIGSPVHTTAAEPSPALSKIIAAAKQEGRLDVWAGSLSGGLLGGVDGMTKEVAGMNAMFGTNIVAHITPDASSVPQLLNKVAVSQASEQPAPTDAFLGTTIHMVTAVAKNMTLPVAWALLLPGRLDDRFVEAGGMVVRILTTLPGGIVYNTKLAPMKPTSLMDLLRPEWKGKLATTPYAASFDLLAANDVWGPDKTLDFARKLSGQISGLIGCQEVERIASGEFAGFALDCGGRDWDNFARAGAPVGFAVPSDFAGRRYYYMFIPKNAAHPNAGILFTTYLLTSEGQDIQWQTSNTDLDTFPDSHMHMVIDDYKKQGVTFREFTIDWWKQHPETIAAQSKVVEIMTKQQ